MFAGGSQIIDYLIFLEIFPMRGFRICEDNFSTKRAVDCHLRLEQ